MMWWGRQKEERWRAAVKAMSMNWTTQLPYHDELLILCNTLLNANRPELAVVVAQMACEILAEQTLMPLITSGRKPCNFNLASKEPLNLYKRLTHDPIDAESFWSAYTTHAQRRHKVVHHGERVSQAEALESFNTARQFVLHLQTVRRRLA